MSIHTILSQEITTFKGTTFSSPEQVEEWMRNFATRIVEEAQREERERIIHLAETYKAYYNPINDAQNTGKHMAMDDLIKELQKEEHDKQI